MRTAKLFRNGRSQAVRLPKEFRFEGVEVNIRRAGKRVILEPKKRRQWPRGYWKSWGRVPDDFRPRLHCPEALHELNWIDVPPGHEHMHLRHQTRAGAGASSPRAHSR